jgi:hypothetical protein
MLKEATGTARTTGIMAVDKKRETANLTDSPQMF